MKFKPESQAPPDTAGGLPEHDAGMTGPQHPSACQPDIPESQDAPGEDSLGPVIVTDLEGRIRFWGQRAEALFGWASAEAHGRTLPDLLATEFPESREEIRSTLVRESFWRGVLTRRHRDGGHIRVVSTWVLQRDPRTGEPRGVIEVVNTLSGLSASEAELHRSEQRLRLAQRTAGVGNWEWDIASGAVTATNTALELWGVPAATGATTVEELHARVHPDDVATVSDACERAIRTGAPCQFEFRTLHPERGQRWLSAHGYVVYSEAGAPLTMLGATVDITDRVSARRELQEREAYLRAVLETVPSAMIVIDENGLIQSFSAAAERMFGHTAADLTGLNVSILMSQPDRGAHDAYLQHYLATGERHAIGNNRVVTGLRKNGEQFPLELWVGEIHGPERRLFAGFMRDVTERHATQARMRELQAELQHMSRLSAMGEMASALAHELNQPLTAIANFIRAGQRMLAASDDPAMRDANVAIQRASEQALRAGQIIRRVRTFVSRGDAEQRSEPVAKLVDEACALARLGAREWGVHVRVRVAPELPPVFADRVQVQQVLVNLIRNAAEAMEGARGGDTPDQELLVSARLAGDLVEFAVADRGPGLADEVARRLFQPFVTTKPQGMGVGLSVCRTIVEAHGGRLWAEPRPGGGTVFRFTIPVAALRA